MSNPSGSFRSIVWPLAVAETIVWAAMYYSFPALLLEWEKDLGWSKTELTGALTLALLVSAATAPFAGRIIDHGNGRTLLTGSALFGAILLIMLSQVTQLWQFYAVWFLLGLAMAGCLYDACFAILTRTMGEKTKRAITLVTLVAGLAGTVSFPSANALTVKFGDASAVNSGRAYGIMMVLVLLFAWWLATSLGLIKPIYWPSFEAVGSRLSKLLSEGFRNIPLWDHVSISIYRVLSGVFYGTIFGVPLGFAMGLSSVARGMFDPIVEFIRPIPPLALIPLIILWFGIDEFAKIFLLFLASFFIMTIAARAGVSGVNISKVHAAYSLGASKFQVLRHVILPNALPEIFIGLRTSMGVCWGTVVAAELVAADRGVGSMIMIAKNFLQTDTVVIGIIIIGLIGFGIEILMRLLEAKLIPWKGKG